MVALTAILVLLLSTSTPSTPSGSTSPVGSQTTPTSIVTAMPTPLPTPSPPAAPDTAPATLITATQQALRAWAVFASTGDLRVVQPCFWPDGPQYQQFQREAAVGGASRGGPPYSYQLTGPSVQATGTQPRVRGTVTVRRPGGAAVSFTWEFFLRYDPAARRWRVWMVIPTAATGSHAGG